MQALSVFIALIGVLTPSLSSSLVKRNDFVDGVASSLADLNTFAEMENDTLSAQTCVHRAIDQFGTLDWDDRVKYFDNGTIQAAPLSFACFVECWYAIDNQTNVATGLPSSAATKATIPANAPRKDWLHSLADGLAVCEGRKDLPTPIVDDDTDDDLTPTDINADDRCIHSLRIDSCVNHHLASPMTDKDSYAPLVSTHDLFGAVADFANIDADGSKFTADKADPDGDGDDDGDDGDEGDDGDWDD